MKRGMVVALWLCTACASGSDLVVDGAGGGTGAIDAPVVVVDAPPGAVDARTDAPPSTGLPTIGFNGSNATAQFGSASGGTSYLDPCPTGQAVIGFAGSLTSATGHHGQIAARCGSVAIVDAGGGAYAARVTAGNLLPNRGLQSGSAWTRTCAADQLVVGFRGRSGDLVDQLTFRCAPLTVAMAGGWTIGVGATVDLEAIGGAGGNVFAQTDCPAGQVATSAPVRAGDGIDAFRLACSTPAAVP